jgi:Sulfotransferase family
MARLKIKPGWTSLRSSLQQKFHRARGRQVLHFLHVGKTGGTAIKHALKAYRVTSGHVLVLHGHRFTLGEVPNGDKFFFCLRSPASRFVSGFYSRQRQGRPRYFVPWTPDEKIAFAEFQTPDSLALALSSADDGERRRAETAMRSIAHVKSGYAQWLGGEGYLLSRLPDVFFIGFQESLAEDFEALKLKLGLTANVKLPSDDVTAHRNPEHLDKRLSDHALENLKRWYADDFKLFALCQRIRRLTAKETISAGAVDELFVADKRPG